MLRAVGIDRQNHFVGCELFESLPMEDSPWTLNNSNVVWWIQPCDTHLWIETPWDDLRLHLNQIQREIQTHAHHQSCRSEWMILCDNDLYFMLLLDWASLNTYKTWTHNPGAPTAMTEKQFYPTIETLFVSSPRSTSRSVSLCHFEITKDGNTLSHFDKCLSIKESGIGLICKYLHVARNQGFLRNHWAG